MKEIVNVQIGSRPFAIEKDAFGFLRSYLDDIRSRLPEGERETADDIEWAMGELFAEYTGGVACRVVTFDHVRMAIDRMGAPATFGERCEEARAGAGATGERTAGAPRAKARGLRRSRSDRSIAGVCGGLAEYLGIDSVVVRILMLLLILPGGVSIWFYVILCLVIPSEEPCGSDQAGRG